MSETLNAGSDEELPVDETSGTDDAASQETTEESTEGDVVPKGKEKALRDTEAALAERKAEFTRMSQQMAELRGQLTTLTQLQSQRAQPVEEKDWMDEMDDEKVLSDPKAAIKFMRDKMRSEIASVLESRDAFLAKQFGASNIDPELKSKVEELRNDPDFSDLPEAKLTAFAKKMMPAKKAVLQPRGSISGSQRSGASAPKKDELSPDVMAYLQMTGAIPSKKRDNTLE